MCFNRACEQQDVVWAENELDFQYPGIGANLFTMAMEGFLFFALTLLLELEFFIHKIGPLLRPPTEESVETSPRDVRFSPIHETLQLNYTIIFFHCIFTSHLKIFIEPSQVFHKYFTYILIHKSYFMG